MGLATQAAAAARSHHPLNHATKEAAMDRLAIFVNDTAHAQTVLGPLLAGPEAASSTIVLCPPKLTHRVGKWLSNRQRQQWQRSWADKTKRELLNRIPALAGSGIEWTVATTRLSDATTQLRRHLGAGVRLLDIRRPTVGHELPPIDPQVSPALDDRWKAPVAITSSLSAVLALVD